MTPQRRAAALYALCQRYYPHVWQRLLKCHLADDALSTLARLPPREWRVLWCLEQRYAKEERKEV